MAGKMTTIHMRKRRTGNWCSQGQGSGFTSPSVKDDAADDAGEDDTDDDGDLSPEDKVKRANNESKRRRIQVRELRRENEQLKAQLANSDSSGSRSGADPSDFILALVESGLPKDRIRTVMRLTDLSQVDDVDDAIEELREEHAFLWASGRDDGSGSDSSDLPGQGSRHNGGRQKGGPPGQVDLQRKYPALRTRGQVW